MDGAEAVSALHEYPPLPGSVFLSLFLQSCIYIVRELHSHLFLLYLKSRSDIKQAWHKLCFKEIFSPTGGEESTAQQDLLEASQLFHAPIWETLRCSQDGWVMDADKDEKMKAASHWMTSSLWWMQWQNNRFNRCPEVTTSYCMKQLFPKALCRKLLLFCVAYSNHTEEANKSSKFLAKHKYVTMEAEWLHLAFYRFMNYFHIKPSSVPERIEQKAKA